MSDKRKLEAIEDLEEEYYQISPDILLSFNKFRPPLNIFKLKEDVVRLFPYYKVGERLSKEQGEELEQMVREGLMFVSRADHPVYVKHISYQLDLVLMDRHLTEAEIADIFQTALTRRMEEFLDQPVKAVADKQDYLETKWAASAQVRGLKDPRKVLAEFRAEIPKVK